MSRTTQKSPFGSTFLVVFGWLLGGMGVLMLGVLASFYVYSPQVVRQFNSVITATSNNTLIYDAAGNLISTVEGTEDRHMVPISRIHPYLQKAVVAIEDRRFFSHKGTDPFRLFGAVWADLKSMSYEQGASTITQQLVKLTLLSSERTISRKAREIFMAIALERSYPKLKLLELYLNRVYLGNGVYGVEKASRAYFKKSAADLNLREAAFLAALIKKPEGYLAQKDGAPLDSSPTIPVQRFKVLRKRQVRVIRSMVEMGWISPAELRKELSVPLVVNRPTPGVTNAPYFVQEVLKELRDDLGITQISGRGYRVFTTLDGSMQASAEKVIADELGEPAPDKDKQKKRKDNRQAALIAVDPVNGAVRALVGGVDFQTSQFNRATQAKRQPGSSIKPLLYAAALEKNFKTNMVFVDEPVRYTWDKKGNFTRLSQRDYQYDLGPGMEEPDLDSVYAPRNYNDRYGLLRLHTGGYAFDDRRMTMARAMELSSNVIAVQLLDKMGMQPLVEMGRRFDMKIKPKMGLCIALGCSEVTLADLTLAYAAFANGGLRVKRHFVVKVTNSQGDVIYARTPETNPQVISPWTAFQMRNLLSGVLSRGTGVNAHLGRPAGGKTGTNDGPRDTWFIGFTPTLATGVWLGTDGQEILPHEAGGRTTAMLWRKFMKKALPPYQGEQFPKAPEPLVKVMICNIDGQVAKEDCPDRSSHFFRESEFSVKLFARNQAVNSSYQASGERFNPMRHDPSRDFSVQNGSGRATAPPLGEPSQLPGVKAGSSRVGTSGEHRTAAGLDAPPASPLGRSLENDPAKSAAKKPVTKFVKIPANISGELEKTLNIHEISPRK